LQIGLPREVGVHGGALHPGAARDLGDRRPRRPHLVVQRRGRRDDAAACRPLRLGAGRLPVCPLFGRHGVQRNDSDDLASLNSPLTEMADPVPHPPAA